MSDTVIPLGPLPKKGLKWVQPKWVLQGPTVDCALCQQRVILRPGEQLHLCSECKYVWMLAWLWTELRRK